MATAKEVITDALEDILEQSAEEPVQPADAQKGLRYLNDMMTSWDTQGIHLGYTKVADLGDEVTVPDGALKGIKAHLSIELAPPFDAKIPAWLQKRADDGWTALLNFNVTPIGMEFPDNLPRGSGNTYYGMDDRTYYEERKSHIVTETGGSIAVEDATEVEE